MTGRARVLAAMNHCEPDRVPVDFGGHRSSGIAAIAYAKLRNYLGLPQRPIRVYDMVQQLAIVDEDVLDIFGVDTIEMGRGFLTSDKDWKDWVLPDGTPCQIPFYVNVRKRGDDWFLSNADGYELGVQRKGCLYFEQINFPLVDRGIRDDDFSNLEEMLGRVMWSVPHPGAHLALDEQGLAEIGRCARALRTSTDRAIVGLFGGNMFELPQWLYRMDNYLTYMGLYPDAVEGLSSRLYSIYAENLRKWLGAVGPYVDIVLFGDDLGGINGPLISPGMYRRYYKPYHAKLWQSAKELAHVKVQLHCCGGIRELLPDLIEAGIDAVNPVQTNCRGMDAAELKAAYGAALVFWGGGCDTRGILPQASPQEIADHVRSRVRILHRGGGFVFQQVHNVLADVPPQNVVAMFGAVNG